MSDKSREENAERMNVPGAQSLLRGLDVLLAVGAATRPLRFREIEQEIQIPRASLHRLLAALASRQLIRYDERTHTYQVGMRVLELSRRTLDQSAIIRAAKPELARVARRLQRTICLMVVDGEEVFVLDFEDPDTSYGRLVRLWPRAKLLEAAAGRAILSAMPKEQSDALLIELAPEEQQQEMRRSADLSVAKALGYAVMHHESPNMQAGAAAAIVDESGFPVAAITCLFGPDPIDAEKLHETGRMISESARRISGHMGMGFNAPTVHREPQKMSANVEVLPTGRDFVGENPLWNDALSRLFWIDVLAPALRYWDPGSRQCGRIELPGIIAGIGFDEVGGIVAAGEGGIFSLDPESGETRALLNPEANRPNNRFNTAGVDGGGRFWAGTMALDHRAASGSLYSIDGALNSVRRVESIGMPKNPVFDPTGRWMYISDTARDVVLAFEVDPETGALGPEIVFATGGENGQLTGLAVDAEGFVWVACSGAWSVRRYTPDGSVDREIAIPVPMPTNCCFGGPHLTTLYVTSSYIRLPPGLSSQAPASGQLIAVETGVRGQPLRRVARWR